MTSPHKHTVSGKSTSTNPAGTVDADLAAEVTRAKAAEAAMSARITALETPVVPPTQPPPGSPVDLLPPATSPITFYDSFSEGLVHWGHNFHPPGLPAANYDPALSFVGTDGYLHLRVEKRADGWHGAAIDAKFGTAQFTQKYGLFEVVAKHPAPGQGLWAAALWAYVNSGAELDVSEVPISSKAGQNITSNHCTLHFAGGGQYNGSGAIAVPDLSAAFHRFAIEWRADRIVWYLDAAAILRYDSSVAGFDATKIPNVVMPWICNLTVDVQGVWPGPPDANTPSPSDLLIAAVRFQA